MDNEVHLLQGHLACPRGVCWTHFYFIVILTILPTVHLLLLNFTHADDVFMVYRLLLMATADDCKML